MRGIELKDIELCTKIKPELLVGTASKTWAFQMATINWSALSERDAVHMLNFLA